MTEFIRKCIEDVVDRWQHLRKTESANHNKVTETMDMHKQTSYAIRMAIKVVKQRYRDESGVTIQQLKTQAYGRDSTATQEDWELPLSVANVRVRHLSVLTLARLR